MQYYRKLLRTIYSPSVDIFTEFLRNVGHLTLSIPRDYTRCIAYSFLVDTDAEYE